MNNFQNELCLHYIPGGLIGFGSIVGTAPAKKDTNILDILSTEKHICIYNSQYLF